MWVFFQFTYEVNDFPAGITIGNAGCNLHQFVNCTEKFIYMKLL